MELQETPNNSISRRNPGPKDFKTPFGPSIAKKKKKKKRPLASV
jgi:hypothetical protein